MKKIAITLFFLNVFYVLHAQVEVLNKDSLLLLLKHAPDDTNKVLLLIRVGNEYERNQPDSAAYFYLQSGDLSKRLKYDVGVLKYISNYTAVLNLHDKYDESLKLNNEAIQLAKKIHNDLQLAIAYSNAGASYYGLNDYTICIDYFLHAQKLLEKINDKTRLGLSYGNLTGLYIEVNQYQKAYEIGLKAIALSRELKDDYSLEEGLQNTGNALSFLKREDTALILFKQTIEIANRINDKQEIMVSYINIAEIFYRREQYNEMYTAADSALTAAHAIGNNEGAGKALVFKGRYEFFNKQYENAEIIANEGLKIGISNNIRELISEAYLLLDDIALAKGDLSKFHLYRKLKDSIQDIISSEQIIKNTQDIEGKYSLEKKENQIKIQNLTIRQNHTAIGILIGFLVTLALVVFFVARNAQQKRKLSDAQATIKEQRITELENEKQLMAADAILKGQEEERLRLAKDLHDGLGGILTGTKFSLGNMKQNMIISADNADLFEKTMNMLDKSITELRRVTHNMMPENLLNLTLDEALADYCHHISQSGALQVNYQSYDIDTITISDTVKMNAYRIVQELINNSVKHANAKQAIVQVTGKDNLLGITVEDDGKGLDVSALADVEGIGYKNIRSRVDYLNGQLNIQSTPGKGTSILIKIPV